MFKNYNNKRFVIFILISILFSLYFVSGRMKVEKNYKNYEICADYDDFVKMGYTLGQRPKDYFKELTKNGVTTITINESTINSMKKDPNSSFKAWMDGMDLIIDGTPEELEFVENGLDSLIEDREIEHISKTRMKVVGRPEDVIYFKSDGYDILGTRVGDDGRKGSVLEYIGLGFEETKINELRDVKNVQISLRPTYMSEYQDPRYCMNRFFESVDKYSEYQKFVVFSGKEMYQNTTEDNKIQDDFIKELNSRELALGMTEASNQRGHLKVDGMDNIAKKESVKKLRTFTTWDYIQTEYDYKIPGHQNGEEITNVYYRAISERNVSAIFLKPFIKDDKMLAEPEVYGKVIGDLNYRLAEKGYEAGHAKPMGNWEVNNKMKFPIALGTVAAAVILLGIVFGISNKIQAIFFILGAILSFIFFILGKKENFGSMIFNLGAIVTYPSLALCIIMQNYNAARRKRGNNKFTQIFTHGILTLFAAILISMIGALMEVSFMSGTNYLLELTIFRGVKISQLLPLIMSIFIFAAYVGFYREDVTRPKLESREVTKALDQSVKFWQAGLGVLVLAILAVFIIRGGNTNTKVPTIELLFRNMLENNLAARPRTKALFIGYPAVFLIIYLGYKNRGEFLMLLLTVFAAIGQADIVNTFSHIRTPLSMSFARIFIEFIGAIILGFILILAAQIIMKVYDKYIAKNL